MLERVRFHKRWSRRARFAIAGDWTDVEVGGTTATMHTGKYASWEAIKSLTRKESKVIEKLIEKIRRDDVFWDVGANVGIFSCLVGQHAGSTIAFEPNEAIADILGQNISENGIRGAVTRAALGDVDDVGGTIRSDARFGDLDRRASIRRADTVLEDGILPPTVMKIDVEGAETAVIDGADRALRGCRLLAVEVHPQYGVDVYGLVETVENAGFSVSWLRDDLFLGESN